MSDTDSLQTYYTLLGIEEDATAAEVRKAYLKRAAECHPDKHPEDNCATERFQALGEAYECLKDPVARKEYDLKLVQLRQPRSRCSSDSPPEPYHSDHLCRDYHDFPPSFGAPPPHPQHGRTFFRASGFSPFPPFPRAFQQGGGIPPPLAMFAEFMASLSGLGGPRLAGGMFEMPFGHGRKRSHLPPGPFGPIPDPFDHPFLRHPFAPSGLGLGHPPPPMPGFPQRPHPHPQARHHHHPYPFPPGPAVLQRNRPGPMMPNLGGPPPGMRGPGQPGGMPGRCHRATFEIKDPAGRTTGFVHRSTMSWSSFR